MMFALKQLATKRQAITSTLFRPSQQIISRRQFSSSHGPEEPIVGPGPQKGEIGSAFEQAAGLERLEYLAALRGENIYLDEELVITKRGTLKEPVLVPSLFEERVVGCTGFPKGEHDAMWMMVGNKRIHRCVECGQAFKLNMLDGHEHSHSH